MESDSFILETAAIISNKIIFTIFKNSILTFSFELCQDSIAFRRNFQKDNFNWNNGKELNFFKLSYVSYALINSEANLSFMNKFDIKEFWQNNKNT